MAQRLLQEIDMMLSYPSLTSVISEYWWTYVARGVAAIVFGLAAIFLPGPTLILFMTVFATYCLVEGAFSLVAGARPQGSLKWGSPLLSGVLSILIGAVALAWPLSALTACVFLLGFWLVTRGVIEISAAIELRRSLSFGQGMMLGVAGGVSMLTGAVAIAWPVIGAMSITYLIGAYAMSYGALIIVAGVRLQTIQAKILDQEDESWRRQRAA